MKDGGPAFQLLLPYIPRPGMSLRDYFAAQAMHGYCVKNLDKNQLAGIAYFIADKMLAAREQK